MPAFVQSVQGDSSTSPLTLALPNPTTAGNCLVVCIATETTGGTNPSVSGVTLGGAAGNFASLLSAGTSTTEAITGIWADPNCAGGQTSVAVSFTGGSSPQYFASVMEFSGLAATIAGLPDKSTSVNAGSASSSWSSGSTATTSQASQVWAGMVATDSVTITGPASPWVNAAQLTLSASDFMSGYQIRSATGAAAYAGTLSPAQFYVAGVVHLSPATLVPVSLTETGTGADALALAAAVLLAEAGNAGDLLAYPSAAVPLADSGAGSDVLATASAVPLTDAGSAADAATPAAAVPVTGTGSGSDTPHPAPAIPAPDSRVDAET